MHSSDLEKNLSSAQFVLNQKKIRFPLGGINRLDFHQSEPDLYKEQLMIGIGIRLIQRKNTNILLSHFPEIIDLISEILEENHHFYETDEAMFEALQEDTVLNLLKMELQGWFCDEMSRWMLGHIKEIAPEIPVLLGKLEYHRLLLIGDSAKLDEAVICDVWADAVYPLKELACTKKNSPDIPTVWLLNDEVVPNDTPHYLSGKLIIKSLDKSQATAMKFFGNKNNTRHNQEITPCETKHPVV